jgi:hypothetical protein
MDVIILSIGNYYKILYLNDCELNNVIGLHKTFYRDMLDVCKNKHIGKLQHKLPTGGFINEYGFFEQTKIDMDTFMNNVNIYNKCTTYFGDIPDKVDLEQTSFGNKVNNEFPNDYETINTQFQEPTNAVYEEPLTDLNYSYISSEYNIYYNGQFKNGIIININELPMYDYSIYMPEIILTTSYPYYDDSRNNIDLLKRELTNNIYYTKEAMMQFINTYCNYDICILSDTLTNAIKKFYKKTKSENDVIAMSNIFMKIKQHLKISDKYNILLLQRLYTIFNKLNYVINTGIVYNILTVDE